MHVLIKTDLRLYCSHFRKTGLFMTRFICRSYQFCFSMTLEPFGIFDKKHSSPFCVGYICIYIVYQCSGVHPSVRPSVRRRPQCLNIFSKTAWPIKAKFCVEPLWVGKTKFCSRHLSHMTKMAAMPIYGKKLQNILLWNRLTDYHETCSI